MIRGLQAFIFVVIMEKHEQNVREIIRHHDSTVFVKRRSK